MRIAFGSFALDTDRFELLDRGTLVPLEPQAFEVLAYLAQHPNRVVSRQELLDAVWGTTFITDSALATRIKEARRAVGDDGQAQQVIRTVHRRGYRFVAPLRDETPAGNGGGSGSSAIAAVRPREPAPGSSAAVAAPPGRTSHLRQLERCLDDVASGQRRVGFLSGESGIGKSTLLGSFLDVAEQRGALIGRGQCIEHHGPGEAYLPLLEAVSHLARSEAARDVSAHLRTYAPTWVAQLPWLERDGEEPFSGVTPARMLRELADLLDTLAQDRIIVLAIEDLHWSDPSTLDVLELAARRNSPAQLMILATVRTHDLGSPEHDAHRLLRELAARGLAVDVPLGPLDVEAIAALLDERTPGLVADGRVLDILVDRTDGHPMFAGQLLDSWIASGAVAPSAGAWQPTDGFDALDAPVPETIRQWIAARLDRLAPADREVLEGAAITGATVTAGLVAAITRSDLDAVERTLARLARERQCLERAGLFEWPDGDVEDRYVFNHSLYRETVIEEIPAGRQVRMHRAAGLHLLERLGARADQQADEIARQFILGRDAERAVPALVQSARRSLGRVAYREARDALRTARDLVQQIADESRRTELEVQVLSMLGSVLMSLEGCGSPDVQATYDRALEICREADHSQRLKLLYGLASVMEFRGEYHSSQRLLEERIALGDQVNESPLEQSESHELLACSLLHQGAFEQALLHAEAGASVSAPPPPGTLFGDRPDIACHGWSAQAHWYLGRPDEAVRRATAALEIAEDDSTRVHALTHLAMVRQYRREADAVEQLATAGIDLAERLGFHLHAVTLNLFAGWARAMHGDPHSLEELNEHISMYRASGMRLDFPYFLALQAEAALAFGDLVTASAALAEAFDHVESKRGYAHQAELLRLSGIVEREGGNDATALALLQEAVAHAHSQEARSLELRARVSLVETLPGDEEAGRALRHLMAEITEGHDTADWIRAEALTGGLTGEPSPAA